MDIASLLLAWAKGKDLAELRYQDDAGGVEVHLVFDAIAARPGTQKFESVQSPAIGTLLYDAARLKIGVSLRTGDTLGSVDGVGAKTPLLCPCDGRVVEVVAASGKGIGYAQEIALLEKIR